MDELQDPIDRMLALPLRRPHVGARFDFDDIKEALRHFQSGITVGKVVVVVP
jgi:NADPH:quinone reductase-like Zn-dependent oxidoreductase